MSETNYIESWELNTSGYSSPSNTEVTRWARDKILERTTVANSIPLFYKEVLRFFIAELGTLGYINSEMNFVKVACVHSNPERTIAKLKQENNIILPILSISQNSSKNADDRRRSSSQVVYESFWSEEKKRAFRVVSLAPRAVDMEYGINIWAKYKANLDQLVEQIRLLFNPAKTLNTPMSNCALSFLETETDNSSIEVGDREERLIRRSFVVNVEGWIPSPKFLITSTGEIEEFNEEATIY